LRGTQMTEIYNNISAWSGAHADAAVAVLKWMRDNDPVILASTRYFGGAPLRGEPYGYAHFTEANRGVIMARNPEIGPRGITIPFDETTGVWPGDKEYVVRIVYPYTLVLPKTVRYGDRFEDRLNGHEVRVYEIWPIDALPEPMPVGCRYQVTARDAEKTVFRLETVPKLLQVLSPVAVRKGTAQSGDSHRFTLPGADYQPPQPATQAEAKQPLQKARIDGDQYVVPVRVPQHSRARVALVFGRAKLEGTATLDGKTVDVDAPHLRLSDAVNRPRGTLASARNWSLFGVEVSPGEHEVRFRLTNGNASNPESREVRVVVDVFRQAKPECLVEVSHSPLVRRGEPLLPQTWAWEMRKTQTIILPTR